MTIDFSNMHILSPKRACAVGLREPGRVFPYYAGYSFAFAQAALSSLRLDAGAVVLDPWNGAGTTTTAAACLGLQGVGIDLNPVMVLAAKASLLSREEIPSLLPLASTLTEIASGMLQESADDPIAQWLTPCSSWHVRAIERALRHALLPAELDVAEGVNEISPLAAFFYACLFRATKSILKDFIPSNPTWVRLPKASNRRLRPSRGKIYCEFLLAVEELSGALVLKNSGALEEKVVSSIRLGDATALPLENSSIDVVLTSPPYCTRIDYAIATSIELSVLGLDRKEMTSLRRSLMGTSTVSKKPAEQSRSWGNVANSFLDELVAHPSKASRTYYLKNHLDYFGSLFKATTELSRVVKPGGSCIVVAQDSYYKEIHNDVPEAICEMMKGGGFTLVRRNDFLASKSMTAINSRARRYRSARENHESVLCFERD